MRRFLQLTIACLAAGAVSACGTPDQILAVTTVPTAAVRFINAVPDTNLMDFRFVDIVDNAVHYKITFRNTPTTTSGVTASTQIVYKNTPVGSRHIRIFLDDSVAAVSSFVLKDTTVNLQEGKLYTAIMYGNARTGGMKFMFYEENLTDPGTNVGLRTLNLTSTPVEVRAFASTGTLPAGATMTAAAYSFSAVVNQAPAQINYNVQPVGGGAVIVPQALALIGQPATVDIEGTPGTTQAGSVVTGIIFPASTVGSKATQFGTPGMSFMWDRRPARAATL